MTIRDLIYRLFCFVFCYCCLLHCGDERRTCVLRKRPITKLTCVFAAGLLLPPPFCSAHSSSYSVTRPRLQKYDAVSPLVFMFFMEQTHRFFFPNKKRFLKKFNSRRIQPFFIFLNYSTQIIVMKCGGTQGWFLNDIFAAVAVLYLEFFNAKGLKLFRA